MYCFDTDVLSATMWPRPPLTLIRRLALVPPDQQHTTAITLGEMLYGAARKAGSDYARRVETLVAAGVRVLPFDAKAAASTASCGPTWSAPASRWPSPTCASPPSRCATT